MGRNNKLKKAIGVFTLASALVLPTAAFASSSGFVYDYAHQLTSADYTMSGNDIIIETNTTYYSGSQKASKNFTIDLYHNYWFGDEYISSNPQAKYGSDRARWNGVGSGTYHFVFKKEQDGQVLKGTGSIHN